MHSGGGVVNDWAGERRGHCIEWDYHSSWSIMTRRSPCLPSGGGAGTARLRSSCAGGTHSYPRLPAYAAVTYRRWCCPPNSSYGLAAPPKFLDLAERHRRPAPPQIALRSAFLGDPWRASAWQAPSRAETATNLSSPTSTRPKPEAAMRKATTVVPVTTGQAP
jgi:hypothetical protein